MNWSVRDSARRVVGRSKKRGKQSGDEDGDSADCGRESTTKRRPGLEHTGRTEATALAPGLDRRGVSPVPRIGASEATERIRKKKKGAPGWSIRGGKKHGTNPTTGPSGGEPGATDWSVRGNRENMTEHPTRRAREQRG